MKTVKLCAVSVLCCSSLAFGWDSSIIYRDAATQRLVYKSDAEGNRMIDFSHAGYKGGTVALPNMAVVRTINPVAGDNTANIQNAINAVAALTPNASGHRGAILLKRGTYPVSGIIYINASGIVLRGEGQGTADTVVVGTGTAQMKELGIIVVKSAVGGQIVASGTTQNITSEIIPVGSRTIEVENGSVYAVGDRLVIQHVATTEWLEAVRYGDTAGDEVPWTPGLGELTMKFDGTITAISGNKIKLDTPIYSELNRSLAQATVFRHTGAGIITECGVENMRVVSENNTTNSQNEEHRWDCVHFIGARNCWALNATAVGFAESGFRFSSSTRSTVLNCSSLDPVSKIEGGRRYNFYIGSECHDILFKGCTARKGRHDFVSNGTATSSGIVFTQCNASQSYASSENHRRWASGFLWDKMVFSSPNTAYVLGIGHNRGNYGTSHGWTGAGMVGWNVTGNQIVVQNPPLGQNYAIACKGTVNNLGPWVFPLGFVEGTGQTPSILSLYEAQLTERKTYGVGPDAPAKLRGTAVAQGASLSWVDVALDETSYVIERSSNGGTSYTVLQTLAANTVAYTDSTVNNATYTYRVKATNSFGSSAYGNPVSVAVTAALTNGAAYVTQAVPSTMVAGQTTSVTLRVKNTGSLPWSGDYYLGSQNPQDNSTWGMNRVKLPAGVTVAVNQEYTFSFNITTPTTAGTYNFQWKMIDGAEPNLGWFGDVTANKTITVTVPNLPPYFTSNPFSNPDATEGAAYNQSFSARAVDPEGGTRTFSLVSGPQWLTVTAAGSAQGTPGNVDVGTNSFLVKVTDNGGLPATATMTIKVIATTATVPWVTNMTEAAAGASITNAGLIVSGVSRQYHATIAAGKVSSQTPGGGAVTNRGASVSLAVSLGPQPQPNIVLNGSFETNTTSWTLAGSAARSTTTAADGGLASLRINTANSSATQAIAIVSGKTYDIRVRVNVSARTAGMVVFDTRDKYDGAGQGQFTFSATNGGWTQYSGSFVATNTSVTLRMFSDATFAGTAYFDQIELRAR